LTINSPSPEKWQGAAPRQKAAAQVMMLEEVENRTGRGVEICHPENDHFRIIATALIQCAVRPTPAE